eukprot:scaffold9125_cov119-Isochrysis_galbana.AAC.2
MDADRPVSAHPSWGARASTSTTCTTSTGSASTCAAADWLAALTAPGSRRASAAEWPACLQVVTLFSPATGGAEE